jgi:hypothetical protein
VVFLDWNAMSAPISFRSLSDGAAGWVGHAGVWLIAAAAD